MGLWVRNTYWQKGVVSGYETEEFWDGLALGAIAGIILGSMMMAREPMTPSERARMAVERRARRAWRRAQGSIGRIAGRFSGGQQ